MTSSQQRRPNYSRRFEIFLTLIVLAILAYSAGWYYAAGWVKDEATAAIAGANGSGRRANCENLDVQGYPFRIGVFCSATMYVDQSKGLSIRAGAFRSAAQIYDPMHVIGELDSPAVVELPGLVALDANWETLRSSVRIAQPFPERVSIEAHSLAIDPAGGRESDAPAVMAETAEFHMRPVGTDADLAVRFGGLQINQSYVDGVTLPPLDGLADVSVTGALVPRDWSQGVRGLSGTLRDLTLSAGEGAGASISGPVAVDEAGLIDADLRVTLRNPRELASILGDLFPENRDEIEMGFSGLAAMGGSPTLPLRISKSEVRMGFLKLGSIPPI